MYHSLTNSHNYNVIDSAPCNNIQSIPIIVTESTTFNVSESSTFNVSESSNHCTLPIIESKPLAHPYVPINENIPIENTKSQISLSNFFDKDINKKNMELYKLIKNHIELLDDKIVMQRSDILNLEKTIESLKIDIKGIFLICSSLKKDHELEVNTEIAQKAKISISKPKPELKPESKPESVRRFK